MPEHVQALLRIADPVEFPRIIVDLESITNPHPERKALTQAMKHILAGDSVSGAIMRLRREDRTRRRAGYTKAQASAKTT